MPPKITRNHEYAKVLSRTVKTNRGFTSLANKVDAIDSADVAQILSTVSAETLEVYDTLDSLPTSSLTKGGQGYVKATQRLYVSDSFGWYSMALVNLTPTQTLDPSGNITLSTDGTSTIVTIIATDSDQPEAHLTYSVESDGNMLATGTTVTQDSSVFTITPLTEAGGAVAGNFTLTFKTTDSVNIASTTKDFSLAFTAQPVSGSASTISLVKAHGNNITNSDITYYNSYNTQSGFTEAGDPTASTFSPYRSGGYSAYFDGSGDYLEVDLGSNGGPDGDCTFEFWVYYTDTSTNSGFFHLSSTSGGFSGSNNAFGLGKQQGTFRIYKGSSGAVAGATAHVDYDNTWVHLALVRSSGTVTLYINGVADANTGTNNNNNSGKRYLAIGGYSSTSYLFTGYLRDFRYVKGTAVYTSNFTPPTEPLTAISGTQFLMGGLPYFADQSSNGHSIGKNGDTSLKPFGPYDYLPWAADDNVGSVHFDGNDTISAAAIDLTGDYTVEGWVYLNEIGSGYRRIFQNKQGNVNAGYWYFYHNGTNLHVYNVDGGTLTNVGTIPGANQWIHLAISRSGNTTRIFRNGKQTASYNGSTSFTADTFAISGYNTEYINGYVADVRVSVGTGQGLYTADFTPPTEPLTRTSPYTKLLMSNLQSLNTVPNASVYDAAAAGRVTLTGNWASRSTTRKFTTSSAVGGTGSLLLNDITPEYTAGDFTVQFWLYPTSWSDGHVFGHWIGGQYHPYLIWTQNNSNLLFYASSNASSWNLASAADIGIARWTNSWKHIAMTYDESASTVRFWLDGTLQSTHTSVTGIENNSYTSSIFSISADQSGGYSSGSHYVQDVKISRSVEYTGNFTPPTTEFEL